jgi:hypothetical protein
MKTDISVRIFLLSSMVMAGILGQGFGGQPGLFGPNFPQVTGVNFSPRFAREPSITNAGILMNLKYPGCSDVDSIGSPILLTYQAEKLIEESLKLQTQGTFVRYIYYKTENGLTNFSLLYRLIFEIRDQSGPNYVGILLDNPSNGIGSVKFLKFIVNPNLDVVKKVLKITDNVSATAYVCGDLKMIFSSFGNDPRNELPGAYPGFNRNSIPPSILKALKELTKFDDEVQKDDQKDKRPFRDCHSSRFVNTADYYTPDSSSLVNNEVPPNKNPFSTYRCDPNDGAVLNTLLLSCKYFTGGPNNGNGEIFAVQGVFKVPFSNALETSNFYGNEGFPTTPTILSKLLDIDLTGAYKLQTYYPLGNANWYGIVTYDGNNTKLGTYTCGNLASAPVAAGQELRYTILVKNLMGFWGGKTSNLENSNNPLNFFGFIEYK